MSSSKISALSASEFIDVEFDWLTIASEQYPTGWRNSYFSIADQTRKNSTSFMTTRSMLSSAFNNAVSFKITPPEGYFVRVYGRNSQNVYEAVYEGDEINKTVEINSIDYNGYVFTIGNFNGTAAIYNKTDWVNNIKLVITKEIITHDNNIKWYMIRKRKYPTPVKYWWYNKSKSEEPWDPTVNYTAIVGVSLGYINPFTGDAEYSANHLKSNTYIPLKGGVDYKLTFGRDVQVAWYDKDKRYISGFNSEVAVTDMIIRAPKNTAFMQFSSYTQGSPYDFYRIN